MSDAASSNPAPGKPPAAEAATAPAADTWLNQRERGTVWIIYVTFRLATLLGRTLMKPLVMAIALHYRLFDKKAVRASRDWLRRVHGGEPGFWAVYRHIHTFAQVTMDRIFLVSGRMRSFEFTRTGNHHLRAQQQSGRGAILLGAHLGSFEAMRAGDEEEKFGVNIVGHFANARMLNELLTRLDPGRAAKVIHIGDDPVGQMARVHDRVEAGEFVALLGDRTGLNERVVTVSFFGQPASFPAGPFLIASLMRCPVYLVFGLYRAPRRYDLFCEPFADDLHLPRKGRQQALEATVQRYAERLEHFCRQAPENWFNFYDFWQHPPQGPARQAVPRQEDPRARDPGGEPGRVPIL